MRNMMEGAIEHFSGYMALEKGLSRNSVSAYKSDLMDFIDFLKNIGCNSYSSVTRANII